MGQDDNGRAVQQLDKATDDTSKISADSAESNAQGARAVSVPASLLERAEPVACVTCGEPCARAQWLVPKFLGGGWACRREHVGARR